MAAKRDEPAPEPEGDGACVLRHSDAEPKLDPPRGRNGEEARKAATAALVWGWAGEAAVTAGAGVACGERSALRKDTVKGRACAGGGGLGERSRSRPWLCWRDAGEESRSEAEDHACCKRRGGDRAEASAAANERGSCSCSFSLSHSCAATAGGGEGERASLRGVERSGEVCVCEWAEEKAPSDASYTRSLARSLEGLREENDAAGVAAGPDSSSILWPWVAAGGWSANQASCMRRKMSRGLAPTIVGQTTKRRSVREYTSRTRGTAAEPPLPPSIAREEEARARAERRAPNEYVAESAGCTGSNSEKTQAGCARTHDSHSGPVWK